MQGECRAVLYAVLTLISPSACFTGMTRPAQPKPALALDGDRPLPHNGRCGLVLAASHRTRRWCTGCATPWTWRPICSRAWTR